MPVPKVESYIANDKTNIILTLLYEKTTDVKMHPHFSKKISERGQRDSKFITHLNIFSPQSLGFLAQPTGKQP
jgi:hypothetical protein